MADIDPGYTSRKIRKFRTDKFDACNKRNFDSCNSCKRLVPSRLHELHESKFPFVSRIEFIRSKLSFFSAHVYGVIVMSGPAETPTGNRRVTGANGDCNIPLVGNNTLGITACILQ